MNDLLLHSGLVLFGLLGLYFGAEWLVRGSVELAKVLGISALVIGLTVVAFGTSAPEMFVGVALNNDGYPGTSVGNVVGSNICNIVLMLGVAALIRPMIVHRQIVKREMPILIVASGLFLVFVGNWEISRIEGGVLFAGILTYLAFNASKARQGRETELVQQFEEEVHPELVDRSPRHIVRNLVFVALGVLVLVVGAESLKKGAIFVAQHFGVSEAIIGLTLVAIGTSLPEIATSVVASLRNHGDIITGNAIGSCIFNLFAVMGVVALIRPMVPIEGILWVDLWIMIGVVVGAIPLMTTRGKLGRIEGVLLLAFYVVYVVLLIQREQAV